MLRHKNSLNVTQPDAVFDLPDGATVWQHLLRQDATLNKESYD